jgi:replication initiation protein RepC
MLLSDWRTNLAPRLRPYLPNATPTWREIVDAADWLRHDRGVSKSLWDVACIAMGREEAAIVSASRRSNSRRGAVHGWEE